MMQRSNSNPERRRAEQRGRVAETIATWYLRAKLFSIRHQRYKTPGGEIDIIATRGELTVFVEVKARKSPKAKAEALASVNQRRIVRAAEFFLARNPQMTEKTLRFDVIFLAPLRWPHHLQGAFEAD